MKFKNGMVGYKQLKLDGNTTSEWNFFLFSMSSFAPKR